MPIRLPSIERRITARGGSHYKIRADPPRVSKFLWRWRPVELRWMTEWILRRPYWLVTVTRGVRVVSQDLISADKVESRVQELVDELAAR